MDKRRIIFLGTPEISARLLKGLYDNGFNIVGVVTKEDKVRGRNNLVEASPVAKEAELLNIPVHKPHRLNKDFQFIIDKKPDLLLTFAYGQLISDEILKIPSYRPMNLHASLLPKYRGAAPIQYALRNGDEETGVSFMEMVHSMDAGDVFAVDKIKIEREDDYTSLSIKLSDLALKLCIDNLPLFFENKLIGIKQDETKVTFCPSIKKEEEKLSLDTDPDSFVNQVRSLSLTPGGYLLYKNEILKIYKAEKLNDFVTGRIGQVLVAHKKDIVLQLSKGQVRLLELQRPGKKRMSSSDFNNGVHDLTSNDLK